MTIESEYVYKEPHYIRMSTSIGGYGGYAVINMIEKKGLSVLTPQKQYVEIDFSDTIPEEYQVSQVIYEMRSLPERPRRRTAIM